MTNEELERSENKDAQYREELRTILQNKNDMKMDCYGCIHHDGVEEYGSYHQTCKLTSEAHDNDGCEKRESEKVRVDTEQLEIYTSGRKAGQEEKLLNEEASKLVVDRYIAMHESLKKEIDNSKFSHMERSKEDLLRIDELLMKIESLKKEIDHHKSGAFFKVYCDTKEQNKKLRDLVIEARSIYSGQYGWSQWKKEAELILK